MWKRHLAICVGMCLMVSSLCALCRAGDDPGATDTVVRKDLNTAYDIAKTYFTDYPNGRLTMPGLQGYGFPSRRNVTIEIVDGREDYLKIVGKPVPGRTEYILNKNGEIQVRSLRKNGGMAGRPKGKR